jgi:hypothetical protein
VYLRQLTKPNPAKPTNIIAHVDDPGTAPPIAISKPKPGPVSDKRVAKGQISATAKLRRVVSRILTPSASMTNSTDSNPASDEKPVS